MQTQIVTDFLQIKEVPHVISPGRQKILIPTKANLVRVRFWLLISIVICLHVRPKPHAITEAVECGICDWFVV